MTRREFLSGMIGAVASAPLLALLAAPQKQEAPASESKLEAKDWVVTASGGPDPYEWTHYRGTFTLHNITTSSNVIIV